MINTMFEGFVGGRSLAATRKRHIRSLKPVHLMEKRVRTMLITLTNKDFKALDLDRDSPMVITKTIEAYESTTSSSQSKEIFSSDSLAYALGIQEHCGHVRGLGLDPCSSEVFGVNARSHNGSSSTSPSYVELQTQVSSLTS
ncbi:hypothetical protein LR48_Vigan02g100700 [Vigna angularis]|uniref:Uncharacterized protein n=1 Tax=Phaseolus angularis TaxID=3914 RepID=A0A0L9TWQ4_PHAAN|nr:hypothetical protein LR48_Vigan02g100700 [Vigna angularis]